MVMRCIFMKENLQVWFKGLAGGVIGGVANAVLLINLVPEAFDGATAVMLLKVAAVSAIVSTALYLKERPLPGMKTGKE